MEELLERVVGGVDVEVKSVEEVRKEVEERGVVAVYLGRENKSYERFRDLALSNIDFPFLHSFSAQVREAVADAFNVSHSDKD